MTARRTHLLAALAALAAALALFGACAARRSVAAATARSVATADSVRRATHESTARAALRFDTVTVRDTVRHFEERRGDTVYITREIARWRDRAAAAVLSSATERSDTAAATRTERETTTRKETAKTGGGLSWRGSLAYAALGAALLACLWLAVRHKRKG